MNKLSHQLKVEDKDKKEKNIDDFIDSQLNIVRITNSELNELKNEILKSEYSLEHQQIMYYLISLQKSADISQSNFRKFHKKTLQYFIQDDHLFHQQDCNVSLHQVMNQSEKQNQIIQALHDESDHRDKNVTFIKVSQYY